MQDLIINPGSPSPLGANNQGDGVNFALYSSSAAEVILCFFSEKNLSPIKEISLTKTENVWHTHIKNLPQDALYAYLIDSQWTIDPYAKELHTSKIWGKKIYGTPLCKVFPDLSFDWGNNAAPQIPFQDLVIYEMHVRGFTQDKSSGVKNPGTFLGLLEKIPYLKQLGVNAIELLPIFEFDETANVHKNPKTKKKLYNYWGYSTINFFSPTARYGTPREFKMMVKALHEAGIEVILDVVYNHTGKSTLEYIDKATYFILNDKGDYADYTGCGNTVNTNHPVVIDLILSSLRYWVSEMHVDGFRFDLASIFCRDQKGNVTSRPPILEAINNDSVLAKTKLIAEAWDCAGLYQVGSFPGGDRWADWNGQYRDVVRRFIKGTDGQVSEFSMVMMGSQNLYYGKAPFNSINFITAHDGFTLRDLVTYNDKHNEDNGEDNRDGMNFNSTWNCGHEGPTEDPKIRELRKRQIRNFVLTLLLSVGTPMVLMADEYGHTSNGNNNPYCQDNQLNYFLWDLCEKDEILHQFFQFVLSFRKTTKFFQRTNFLTDDDVTWHGIEPDKPDFSHSSRFIAYFFHRDNEGLYMAFNACFKQLDVKLPPPPEGQRWKRIIDTAYPKEAQKEVKENYSMAPYSAIVLWTKFFPV
ncbi:MAG: glycogen-debranching protein [Verrucomicrobia bacterium]|nr:glycogen-debranching protein [Verrucomicrobiota bacterium]